LLQNNSDHVFLEVGPGRTLTTFVKQHPAATEQLMVFASVRHPREQESDVAFCQKTLGQMWLAGVAIDWAGLYTHEQRQRVALPAYPFERRRYWIEAKQNISLTSNPQTELATPTILEQNSDSGLLLHPRSLLLTAYVAPTNEIEKAIAIIWQELLGIEQIGIYDNFFELGGNSLIATQLMSRVQEIYPVELSFNSLFETPTIAHLAQVILQIQITDTNSENLDELLAEINQLSEEEIQVILMNKN